MHAIDGAAIAALVTLIADILALGDLGLAISISALSALGAGVLVYRLRKKDHPDWQHVGPQGAWLVSSSARMR